MRLLPRALVAGGLAVAALAPAAEAAPTTICREVSHSGTSVAVVCLVADARQSGTTVAPFVNVGCTLNSRPICVQMFDGPLVDVGTTGFVPNPSFTPPTVDPATGSVKVHAGTVGTLWVAGIPVPIAVSELCVGDPSYC